jgi:flagellar biosynthesis protein FliR
MEQLSLALDPAWATGLVLALTRMTGFVVASPILNRVLPWPGRVACVVAFGLFLTEPAVVTELGGLVVAALLNAVLGIALGFLTGIVFQLFAVAGGIIDMTSGMAVSALFDPGRGEQAGVYNRIFALTALTLFLVLGGLHLFARGLALSVAVIPLDGQMSASGGLATVAVRALSQLMLAGLELALPVVAALFLAEVVLGIAARFAPQANVFLLGLPLKMLIAMTVAGISVVLMPEAVDGVMGGMRDTFVDVLDGLRA